MRSGTKTIAILTLALTPIVVSAACARTEAQPAEPPRPRVTVAQVISRDVTEFDEFTGRLEAVTTVELRPRVSGYIAASRFVEGSIVRRGDVLFEIDAFLDNSIDPATGTIRVRATLRNADRSLTPGLFVRVRLPATATAQRGLLVQDLAIGTDLDKRFVLVVTPDHVVQYRAVTLGPVIDELRLVRSGLDPSDLVIVDGLQRVRPGARVDIDTVAMDEHPTGSETSAPETTASQGGN